jgi:hypothetical protein
MEIFPCKGIVHFARRVYSHNACNFLLVAFLDCFRETSTTGIIESVAEREAPIRLTRRSTDAAEPLRLGALLGPFVSKRLVGSSQVLHCCFASRVPRLCVHRLLSSRCLSDSIGNGDVHCPLLLLLLLLPVRL